MAFSHKYQPLSPTGDDVDEERTSMLPSTSIPQHLPKSWERYLTIFYATLLFLVVTNFALLTITRCETGRLSWSSVTPWQDARTLPQPDQYIGLEGDHYGNASYSTVPYRRAEGGSEVDIASAVFYAPH